MLIDNGLRRLALSLLFPFGLAYAQSGLVCATSAGVSALRAEGLTEKIGDILLDCSGGNPGTAVVGNLTLFFDVNVTNKLSGNSFTDVMLTVDTGTGPVPAGVVAQPYLSNGVTFNGLSFTVPASGKVTLRVSNVRVAASQLGPGQSVEAHLSLTLGGATVTNVRFIVGRIQTGLLAAFSSEGVRCAGSPLPAAINLTNLFAAGTRFFSTRLTEGFAEAFEKKGAFSDTGARIKVTYSGFPAQARLFVPDAVAGSSALEPTAGGDLGVPASGGQYAAGTAGSLLLIRVKGADDDGAGGTLAITPPASGTVSFDSASEVPLANGSGSAVYEVVDADPFVRESAQFPTFLGLPRYSGNPVIANASVSFAPVSTLAVAAMAPVPRFVALEPPSDCAALGDCNAAYFPRLVVNAPPLQFSAPVDGFLQRAFVGVRNGGGGELIWTASVTYQSGADWVSLFPHSGVNNTTIWFDAHPEKLSPGTYQATFTVDAGPLAGSRSFPVTFTVTAAAPAPPTVSNVTNGASFLPGIASGTWITILGTNLAATTRTWSQADFSGTRLPTQLDGVSVNINGKPSYVSYVSPTQINVLVPDDAAEGPAPVEVVTVNGNSIAFSAQKAKFSPAFFLFDAENRKYVASVHPDGAYLGKPNLLPGLPTRPAQPGDIIQLYGTGFGPTDPALPAGELVTKPAQLVNSFTVRIGGVVANVAWAGLISPGLYQFNVTVPDVPGGDQPVVADLGEFRTQENAYITVQR